MFKKQTLDLFNENILPRQQFDLFGAIYGLGGQ